MGAVRQRYGFFKVLEVDGGRLDVCSPVDERSDLHQFGLLAEQEPVRIGHIEDVQLRQPNDARPLPVVKTERVVPQLEILRENGGRLMRGSRFLNRNLGAYLEQEVVEPWYGGEQHAGN